MTGRSLFAILAGGVVVSGGVALLAQQPAAKTPPPSTAVVQVRMTGNGTTTAAFEPSTVTIKESRTVRFVMASGGPHNVAFYPDSIPANAAAALRAGMPHPMSDLIGPLLTKEKETYDVSFAGAPKGTYKAYCMPHVALGMKLTIKVE